MNTVSHDMRYDDARPVHRLHLDALSCQKIIETGTPYHFVQGPFSLLFAAPEVIFL